MDSRKTADSKIPRTPFLYEFMLPRSIAMIRRRNSKIAMIVTWVCILAIYLLLFAMIIVDYSHSKIFAMVLLPTATLLFVAVGIYEKRRKKMEKEKGSAGF
jgi:ATP/ADP translocase